MKFFGKRKDRKDKDKPDINDSTFCPVLGVSLSEACRNSRSYDGESVPAIVRQCLDYVKTHGITQEGIYRLSPPKSRLDELERLVNSGQSNVSFNDPHEAAGLVKRFLRQLPEHILTQQLKQKFELKASECKCKEICRCNVVVELRELLMALPLENISLLAYIFRHFQLVVQQVNSNKMSLPAIGVLLQANLSISRSIIRIFVLNATDLLDDDVENKPITQLFNELTVKPYIPPRSLNDLRDNPPKTKKELENEIFKQQNLLAFLHEQVQNLRSVDKEVSKDREDAMWGVQQAITSLKRQLKIIDKKVEEVHNEYQLAKQPSTTNSATLYPFINEDEKEENLLNDVNPVLFEKQLWATHASLLEEIAEEKRQIGQLLSRLREVTSVPKYSQKDHTDNNIILRQNSHRSTNSAINRQSSLRSTCSSSTDDTSEEARLGAKKDALLSELIRYRNICAQLRARYEHKNVIFKALKNENNNNLSKIDANANQKSVEIADATRF